jgi:hypothetical protein
MTSIVEEKARAGDAMRLTGPDGPVDHAWLDAEQVSLEYAGCRCRIAVGATGGTLCVDVEYGEGRTLDALALRVIATDAVVMVEAACSDDPDAPRVSLVDEEGRHVALEGGSEGFVIDRDMVEMDDDQLTAVMSLEGLPWPTEHLLWILAILSASTALAFFFGHLSWAIYACTAVMWIVAGFALNNLIAMCRLKMQHDEEFAPMRNLAMREAERRMALDVLVGSRRKTN